jgi:prepilin-type N-terminal cleavage/methylation domain-containing protein
MTTLQSNRARAGFTLIELMIVVLIVGILAAIAIPNFLAMSDRAKEGAVKANMHTFQLAAEDYATQNEGLYAAGSGAAATVASCLPTTVFRNPWTTLQGDGAAWMDGTANTKGIVGYLGASSDSTSKYTITGYGASALLTVALYNGPGS